MRREMSHANNSTFALWNMFMPRRKEISDVVHSNLYSIQRYPSPNFFNNFSLDKLFEKWAAIEVSVVTELPDGMEAITIEKGLYAVFLYKGIPSEAATFFQYIFSEWLPSSGYLLDDRLHFEVLNEKYKMNDLNSEEEVWIPIRLLS